MARRDLPVLGGETPRAGRWRVELRGADFDGRLRVRLHERAAPGVFVELALRPATARGRALVSTAVGEFTFLFAEGMDEERAKRAVRAFAKNLEAAPGPFVARFPHLLADRGPRLPSGAPPPDASLATQAALPFDPPGLAELLAPAFTPGGPAVAGYQLRAIGLPTTSDRDLDALLVHFDHEASGERLHLEVGPTVQRAFALAAPLELGVRRFGRRHVDDELIAPDEASLASVVAVVLRRALSRVSLRFVEVAAYRALSVPSARPHGYDGEDAETVGVAIAPALNLALDAPCGQSCAFCSVAELQVPEDGGERALERAKMEMRHARDAGVKEVRLNGIDPLAYSRVLEVVDAATELAFERMTVFSPGRAFADPAFRRAFLRRAPRGLTVMMPLYGADAAAHDRVTGRPGSFAEVDAAIEALATELRRPARLELSTVLVRSNVAELPKLVARADRLRVPLHVRLPYPMQQSAEDPYVRAAMAEPELLDAVLAVDRSPRVLAAIARAMPHPCVLFAAEQTHGLPMMASRLGEPHDLPGTEYRSARFVHADASADVDAGGGAFAVPTVSCPHAGSCALAPECAQEQYALYVDLYGWDAMTPVSAASLYHHPPPT